MTDEKKKAVPGWYPHPRQEGLLRRWDGDAWTDETRPIERTPRPDTNDMTKDEEQGEITVFLLTQISRTVARIAFWITLWSVLSILGAVITFIVVLSAADDNNACSDSTSSSLPDC